MKESVFSSGIFLIALLFVGVAFFMGPGNLTGHVINGNTVVLSWDNPCPSGGTQYRILKTGFAGWWQDKITKESVTDEINSSVSYQFFASCLNNGVQGQFNLFSDWKTVEVGDSEVTLFSSGQNSVSSEDISLCVSNCEDRECGDDGCGGTCGGCSFGEVCSGAGVCSNPYKEGYFESKCSSCGKGWFNLCDEVECSSLGNCTFFSSFFSGKCE